MTYYHARIISGSFNSVLEVTRAALAHEGFGVLSDIDVQSTLKTKLNVDFGPYRILGACNPGMAHEALQLEPRIGVMLPCNVIVRQVTGGIEVAAVEPAASMASVDNPGLVRHARTVGLALRRAVDAIPASA